LRPDCASRASGCYVWPILFEVDTQVDARLSNAYLFLSADATGLAASTQGQSARKTLAVACAIFLIN
jgi:hypothetical protein